jgi:hypothetical protein
MIQLHGRRYGIDRAVVSNSMKEHFYFARASAQDIQLSMRVGEGRTGFRISW